MRFQTPNYFQRSSPVGCAERKLIPHELEGWVVVVNQHVVVWTYNYDVMPRREICVFRVRKLPVLVTSRDLG